MAEQSNPAMITETKINGVTYTVRSSFKEGVKDGKGIKKRIAWR